MIQNIMNSLKKFFTTIPKWLWKCIILAFPFMCVVGVFFYGYSFEICGFRLEFDGLSGMTGWSVLGVLECISAITVLCCFIFYIFFPVERNHILFGRRSLAMFHFTTTCVVSFILTVSGIHNISNRIEPKNITDWNNSISFANDSIEVISSSGEKYTMIVNTQKNPSASNQATQGQQNNQGKQVKQGKQEKSENQSNSESVSIERFWAIVSQFLDPGNLPSASGKGRPLALFLAFAGIIALSGFLLSSLVSFLTMHREKWQKGLIHYKCRWSLTNYVVIIGVNDQTAAIAKQALKNGARYVLIQTRQDVEKMRMRLDLSLDKSEEGRIVYYFAERTSWEDIKMLKLEKANEVFILGEDNTYTNEADHDAFNIECLGLVSKYMDDERLGQKRKEQRLKCHVAFEYQGTFTAFKVTHLYKSLNRHVEFIPFNVQEIWAKKVLVDNFAVVPGDEVGETAVQKYKPLDGDGIGVDSDKTVNLVIMGMNQMGTAFAVQAALVAHYPNFAKNHKYKTTITFIDDHAITEGEFFRGRFASLFDLSNYRVIDCEKLQEDERIIPDFEVSDKLKQHILHLTKNGEDLLDIQWEFIQGNVASPHVVKYLSELTADTNNIVTLAICFNKPQQAIATALYLPSHVLRTANQVLVYQQCSFDILNEVAKGNPDWKRYENMAPFGMIEGCYADDSFDSMLAKVEHYTYVTKQHARKNENVEENGERKFNYCHYQHFHGLNDGDINYSLVQKIEQAWEELDIVQKLANIDMVDSIPTKLRSMGIQYNGNTQKLIDYFEGTKSATEGKEPVSENVPFDYFAQSEHMRWMMERLLMGFRALTSDEQEVLEQSKSNQKNRNLKEEFKLKHRAHLDICSNEKLAEIDPSMKYNDLDVIAFLPIVLQYSEWAIVMNYIYNKPMANSTELELFLGKRNNLRFKYVEKGQTVAKAEAKDIVRKHTFWMADTPVTQRQWREVTGKNNKTWKNDSMPVVNISKDEIDDFLLVLRKKTGLYFALPNKKEWKYAALLSTAELAPLFISASLSESERNKKLKHHLCFDTSHPVGRRFFHSQYGTLGLYDMLGNVWEWTRTAAIDENHSECFYFCGGSWHFKQKECDLYSKTEYWYSYWLPKLKSKDIGFRLIWQFNHELLAGKIAEACRQVSEKDSIWGKKKKRMQQRKEAITNWFKVHPMQSVEGGYFMMGTENEETHKNFPYPDKNAGIEETPHHYVKISQLQMCAYPVTQELWNLVMNITPKENPSVVIGNDYPQTNVSYRTIVDKFLPKLNKLTGENYRLPTEAEWEYVAKCDLEDDFQKELYSLLDTESRTTTPDELLAQYHKKQEEQEEQKEQKEQKRSPYMLYSGSDDPLDVAWFSQMEIQKVNHSMKKHNACGIYGMSGNIWEWVLDYYQSDMYDACVKGKDKNQKIQAEPIDDEYNKVGYITNPVCLDDSYAAHVFRGGSWAFPEVSSRATSVNFWVDSDEDDDLGFRLVVGDAVKLERFQKKRWYNKLKVGSIHLFHHK